MLELNTIHELDNRVGIPQLPEKCAKMIISDPPYFEIKGAFDFVFKSFGEYMEFMEHQAQMYKRILADNGSLFVYGHAKKIAYVQCIFDKYFNLENNITWKVPDRQTNKGVFNYRCFAPVTERILFYSNEKVSTNGCYVFPVRDYLRAEIMRIHGTINYREINTVFETATNGGGMASAILSLEKTEPAFITESQYLKLRDYLNLHGTDALAQDHGVLRAAYDDLRRPFNNIYALTDVMEFSQEGHNAAKYDHDTMKPEALTRALIQTTTRKGDLIVIPFAGSGTEASMSIKEGRQYVAFEIDPYYVIEGRTRCALTESKPTLF